MSGGPLRPSIESPPCAGSSTLAPATRPRLAGQPARLLAIDPAIGAIDSTTVDRLPALLHTGDLLLVNDAATLPASFHGTTARGEPIEIRLAGQAHGTALGVEELRRDTERAAERLPDRIGAPERIWRAVLFGAGDWRQRTEDRPAPPRVHPGDGLTLAAGLRASVLAVSAISPRLITLRFEAEGSDLWSRIYRAGRPVQYSYLEDALALWDVQSVYAGPPASVEPASAGLLLDGALLAALRERGAAIAAVTHAAGLSSTGDPEIDAALPLPERSIIPSRAVGAIVETRARGGRIIAVGTSVVRAVEGRAVDVRRHERWRRAAAVWARLNGVEPEGSPLAPGAGFTDLRVGPDHALAIVDGIVTGMHEPGSSHHDLLLAFAPDALLVRSHAEAVRRGYLGHELGDGMVILPGRRSA